MKLKIFFIPILLLLFFGEVEAARMKRVYQTKPFDKVNLCFNPELYKNGVNQVGEMKVLGNGRIFLTKVSIPKYKRDIRINARVEVTSNGDPWDKSGSCFIIPSSSVVNMIKVAEGSGEYPKVDSLKYGSLKGIVAGEGYLPTTEIMRFMTPFGVGHFSLKDTSNTNKRLPVYIDGWAESVEWNHDITDLYPLMQEEVWVGVFIDTWTPQGYNFSLELTVEESIVKSDKLIKQSLLPLINTVYYLGQGLPDIFSKKGVEIPFNIPKGAKNIRLKYIVTGHGGHSGGDEFTPCENRLSIDGAELLSFTPWRRDCASFRRFNPTSGVWLRERKVAYIDSLGRAQKVIEEPIASSDLSRSNWCPGSSVEPVTIMLHNLSYGEHTLKIEIPNAQKAEGNKLNHWLVSAYLVWE